VRILTSVALFSGLTRLATVPGGSLSNASLVGAKTVNGPGPCSVSTSPAACTAATSVVWSFELTAFWMMFFDGYIGAPPTITVCSDCICANATGPADKASGRATAASRANERVLVICPGPSVGRLSRRTSPLRTDPDGGCSGSGVTPFAASRIRIGALVRSGATGAEAGAGTRGDRSDATNAFQLAVGASDGDRVLGGAGRVRGTAARGLTARALSCASLPAKAGPATILCRRTVGRRSSSPGPQGGFADVLQPGSPKPLARHAGRDGAARRGVPRRRARADGAGYRRAREGRHRGLAENPADDPPRHVRHREGVRLRRIRSAPRQRLQGRRAADRLSRAGRLWLAAGRAGPVHVRLRRRFRHQAEKHRQGGRRTQGFRPSGAAEPRAQPGVHDHADAERQRRAADRLHPRLHVARRHWPAERDRRAAVHDRLVTGARTPPHRRPAAAPNSSARRWPAPSARLTWLNAR